MARKLHDTQLDTLLTVFKFRYVTAINLATTRTISPFGAYKTLKILTKAGYLGERYNKDYHLLHKGARYYLTDKALDYLRAKTDIRQPAAIWKARRQDSHRSTDFVDHQVAIHTAYNAIRHSLGDGEQKIAMIHG